MEKTAGAITLLATYQGSHLFVSERHCPKDFSADRARCEGRTEATD
jgi:hypothetical protein